LRIGTNIRGGDAMKVFKMIVCIILAASMLLLAGCNNWWDDAEQFRLAYAQFRENPSVKIIAEEYAGTSFSDLKLKSTVEEWRNGEDFYQITDDGSRYLHKQDEDWRGVVKETYSSWVLATRSNKSKLSWMTKDAEPYLAGQSYFAHDGETIIMEHRSNSRHWTESKRTGSVFTFYMTKNWEIFKIIVADITFKGDRALEEEIETLQQNIYYITPVEQTEVDMLIRKHFLEANGVQ